VVVSSPGEDIIYGSLSYPELNEGKATRVLKRELAEMAKGERVVSWDPKVRMEWALKSESGASRVGTFERLDGEILILKNKGGHEVRIELSKLTPKAADFARHLAKRKSGAVQETGTPDAMREEEWMSTKGKVILATFISLAGDSVTLKLANGKETRVPLKRLSQESQKKAQERAAGSQ